MKNYFTYILLITLAFSSCKNEPKELPIPEIETSTKSTFYKEVVLKNGGDFTGFTLGSDFDKSVVVIDKNFLAESDGNNYLLYKTEKTYTNSSYELSFLNNSLSEIYFDTYVYDEKGMFDKNGSLLLFNDIKDDFLKKYGNKYMETSNEENEILYWSVGSKNIQLIHEIGKAAVHVYLDIVVVE